MEQKKSWRYWKSSLKVLGALVAVYWVVGFAMHKQYPVAMLVPAAMADIDPRKRYLLYGDRECEDLMGTANNIETVLTSSWNYFADQESGAFGYSGPIEYLTGAMAEDGEINHAECVDLGALRAAVQYEINTIALLWDFIGWPLKRFGDFGEVANEAMEIADDVVQMIDTNPIVDDSANAAVGSLLSAAIRSPCGRIAVRLHVIDEQIKSVQETAFITGVVPVHLDDLLDTKAEWEGAYSSCIEAYENFRDYWR